nr:unnamed protein product [Spirometra erinaceieuropaei]
MRVSGAVFPTPRNPFPIPVPPYHGQQVARTSQLPLAAWNVRSLLDNPRSSRPKRRTASVVREMTLYKVGNAAFSGIRFSEQGRLEEVVVRYTVFWDGRPKAERCDAGVAFAIRNNIVGRLLCLLQGVSDRHMSLRLPPRGAKSATVVSIYTTSLPNDQLQEGEGQVL